MILRDLSFWTLVKLTLFLTIFIPLIVVLLLIPLALLDVPGVTVSLSGDTPPKIFGIMGFEIDGPPIWITALFITIINLLATCKFLQLIAKFTPIGNLKIGEVPEYKN